MRVFFKINSVHVLTSESGCRTHESGCRTHESLTKVSAELVRVDAEHSNHHHQPGSEFIVKTSVIVFRLREAGKKWLCCSSA
jgi:hypothetical protein